MLIRGVKRNVIKREIGYKVDLHCISDSYGIIEDEAMTKRNVAWLYFCVTFEGLFERCLKGLCYIGRKRGQFEGFFRCKWRDNSV